MTLERCFILNSVILCVMNCAHAVETKAPLADAVQQQDRAATNALLDRDVDVNAAQVDGMTALHWSVYHDNLDLTKQLISKKANVKAANRYGVTSLSIACLNGNGEIVELLLKQGADPNQSLRGGETPLMTAARTGKLGPVTSLSLMELRWIPKNAEGKPR